MIKHMVIGFVVLTFIVIFVTILFQYQMGGVALQAKLQELKGIGILMRGALFVTVFGYWDFFMNWFADKQGWDSNQLSHALNSRWKIAGYMVLVELFIVQNVLAKLVDMAVI
jgi:hypothetical protein